MRRSKPRSRKVVYVSTVGIFGNTHGKVVDETYEHPGKDFTSYYEETKLEAPPDRQADDRRGRPARRDRPAGRRLRARRHLAGRGPTERIPRRQAASLLPFPELGICLTHVEDIAGGILLALDKGKVGETYVISGPATTMREAIDTIAAVSGRKAPKRDLPTPLMKALTPIGPLVGKMMGQPPNLRELISTADGVTFWASYEKAGRELGYSPRGLEEGMRQTLERPDQAERVGRLAGAQRGGRRALPRHP